MSQIKNSAEGVETLRASLTREGIESLREKKIDACTKIKDIQEVWDDPIFNNFNELFEKHITVIDGLCDDMESYDTLLSNLQEALDDYERQTLNGDFLGF